MTRVLRRRLTEAVDRLRALLPGVVGAGEVRARFRGAVAMAASSGPRAWSCDRILGSNSGPCVRMGERAGVLWRVLGADTVGVVKKASEGVEEA